MMFPMIHGLVGTAGGWVGPLWGNGIKFAGGQWDFFEKSGDLTGNSDTKLFSGSVWIKKGTYTQTQRWYSMGNAETRIRQLSSGKIQIQGNNAGVQLKVESTSTYSNSSWHHYCWCFDMSDTGKRFLYVDDVSDLTVITYNDSTIDFTRGTHRVGANDDFDQVFNGCMADFWIGFNIYYDFSITANRRKFITAGGAPVNLGATGQTPTGTAPICFFSGGDPADFHNNLGTGGGFTKLDAGAVSDCSSDPS